jgi:hypothetical protein
MVMEMQHAIVNQTKKTGMQQNIESWKCNMHTTQNAN